MPRIEISLFVAAPPARCFDLARSVDFHMRSAAATGERAIAGRVTGLLGAGEEVTWRARHFGVWQDLTSRITEFQPPTHFRDSLVRGAFRRFDHDHFFTVEGEGTRMRDVFAFATPLGPVGWAVERLFLTQYLRQFLEHRCHAVRAAAESSEWRQFLPEASG